jgi:hypothetical protein
MNGSVIVWDLETVPDPRGFAAANGLAGKTDEEVREAIQLRSHIPHHARPFCSRQRVAKLASAAGRIPGRRPSSGRDAEHAVLLIPFGGGIDQSSQSDAARQPAPDRGLDY